MHSVFHLGYLLSIMWYLPLHFDWDGQSGASWRVAAADWLRELTHRAHHGFMHHTCKWWRCVVCRCLRSKREAGTCSWAVCGLLGSRKGECSKRDHLLVLSPPFISALLPKAGWDESHLWLATGCRPAGPALGAALLHTVVTYRLTFMTQHARVDFLGQDQVARLRSGPDFVTVQLSLHAAGLSVAGRARAELCLVLS